MLFPHNYRTYKIVSTHLKTKLNLILYEKEICFFLLLFSEINVSGTRRVTLDTFRRGNVLILGSEQPYELLEANLF